MNDRTYTLRMAHRRNVEEDDFYGDHDTVYSECYVEVSEETMSELNDLYNSGDYEQLEDRIGQIYEDYKFENGEDDWGTEKDDYGPGYCMDVRECPDDPVHDFMRFNWRNYPPID